MANRNIVLVVGKSTCGKSSSLEALQPMLGDGVLYLNTEANKELPFPHSFNAKTITHPLQIFQAFEYANKTPEVKAVVLDSLTFLMDMVESKIVNVAADKRSAWGEYREYYNKLTQDCIANCTKPVIITAHTSDVINDDSIKETIIKLKGSVMNTGVEAAFSTIVAAKKVNLEDLKDFDNDMLNIDEDDEDRGYKYVFQTRVTPDTVNERIRSAKKMFAKKETYIDNDITHVLKRIQTYYTV